jgi:polyribonucleotide nucleotidyltransferase
MEHQVFTTEFAGKPVTIEVGKLAQQANASCTVRMGDTVVMATAVQSKESRGMPFFPLMVDYEEKLYAAGRIKGSRFIKREGRPTDDAVLVARFIDRALRPLFDQRGRHDVQVIITALAFDGENDPDILGLIGASCALHMSDIAWNGPIGAIRVSKIGEELVFNPSYEEREQSTFDLDLAGTTEKIVMIECRANEAQEEDLLEAFEAGRAQMQPIIDLIEDVRAKVGKEKVDYLVPSTEEGRAELAKREAVEAEAKTFMHEQMQGLFFDAPRATKAERNEAKNELKKRLIAFFEEQGKEEKEIEWATDLIYDYVMEEVSRAIIEKDLRLDGRALTEIRPLSSEVQLLPRVHGSGLFNRGETQALTICTLGSPGDKQVLDGMEVVGEKHYMHHYSFPPYSVGEAKPLRGAGRREIGHGALAEKALEPVLPNLENFPYTIRVVSETLSSNGSSSMASTCGSTLALMDAGVPLSAPVGGIAMGLASYNGSWKVITDLQDLEDGPGGMDFKITGTRHGITAIQMDTKTEGLTHDIIVQTLEQAKPARNEVIDVLEQAIAEPRPELSPYAPRIISLTIHPDKIREVIGPGGKMINEIIETTGVETIDIEQDGTVMITSSNGQAGEAAREWIHSMTREIKPGETFTGTVSRIMDFGAIVEILPGRDGMVHISELAPWRVEKTEDIVKLGDSIHVKVLSVEGDRTSLSMKQAEGNTYPEKPKTSPKPQGRPGHDRGPKRSSQPRNHKKRS